MVFKMKGSKFYGKGNQSPLKRAGIFEGVGEDRRRIGSEEAAELETEGKTITRTAADNPDKEEGAQQIKNLGETYAEIDAEMQKRAEGKETLDPSQVNYRKQDDPRLMIRMMSSGPVTAKDAEKKIRKHENLEGGNPMRIEGESYYIVNGVKMSQSEYDAYKKAKEPTESTPSTESTESTPSTTTKIRRSKPVTITMTAKEYREMLKKQKNQKK